jgi:hypothetical protein
MPTRSFLVIAAVVVLSGQANAQSATRPTYEAVVKGMSCKQQTSLSVTQLDCEYRVGRSLEFVIAGVGQRDAAITIVRSSGYEADYYASIGVAHGCVIVKPGTLAREAAFRRGLDADMAFVSPKTGKVYKAWQDCDRAS